jgi:hypothetical protein
MALFQPEKLSMDSATYEAKFMAYIVGLLTLDGQTGWTKEEAEAAARNELENTERSDDPEGDAAECLSYWDDDGE